MNKEKIIKEENRKKDEFDKVAQAICAYLKVRGWNVLVVGESRIQQPIGSLKYNFELVFRFTGKKLKCQKKSTNKQ